jgi:hypothetical protein
VHAYYWCEVIAADLLQERAAYLPLSALYRSAHIEKNLEEQTANVVVESQHSLQPPYPPPRLLFDFMSVEASKGGGGGAILPVNFLHFCKSGYCDFDKLKKYEESCVFRQAKDV